MLKIALSRLSFLYCLLLLLLFTDCSIPDPPTVENQNRKSVNIDSINEFVTAQMATLTIPGAALAVVNEGKLVLREAYGYANVAQKQPVTPNTIFEGASISKSVFSFFVMTFVEEGILDLDRPLFEYLPYPDISHDERYQKITARMVLSHRSGFPNWRENEEDGKLKIKFEPGTDFEYSGEGYQYLAMVLKEVIHGDWNDLERAFQTRVATPLGMANTTFIPTTETVANKAQPYDKNGDWIDLEKNYWYKKEKGVFVAPSSIHTEPNDFSKWMIAVMNKELLAPSSYAEILRAHTSLGSAADGTTYSYSLGFITGDKAYENTFSHTGSNDGFTCYYFLDTEKDWGFVVFTNSEYGEELGEKLLDFFQQV